MSSGSAPPQPLSRGSCFNGRYEIVRCIKAGGMGAVYEAFHVRTRRRCALKVMLPALVIDPDLRSRFQREATIAADVHSEHIVQVHDAGIDPETTMPFLVMELLRGEELAAAVHRRGSLPLPEVLELLQQAAHALDRTHAAGVVHRDLKPENLFVTQRDDGSACVKLLDFGIAKMVARGVAASHSTRGIGTPLFMAPEQIRDGGDIRPATDIFALGHIAYFMLTGEAYWEEEVRNCDTLYPVLMKMAEGPREQPSMRAARRMGIVLPAGFDAWFARATARPPSARFGRASEMVVALRDAWAPAALEARATTDRPEVDTRAVVRSAESVDTDPSAPTLAGVPVSDPSSVSGISGPSAGWARSPRSRWLAAGVCLGALAAGWVLLRALAPSPAPAPDNSVRGAAMSSSEPVRPSAGNAAAEVTPPPGPWDAGVPSSDPQASTAPSAEAPPSHAPSRPPGGETRPPRKQQPKPAATRSDPLDVR